MVLRLNKDIIQLLNIINDIMVDLKRNPSILPGHILCIMYYLYSNQQGGRKKISDYISLPSSRSKKILEVFEKKDVIYRDRRNKHNVGRTGSILTKDLDRICSSVFHQIMIFDDKTYELGSLTLGSHNLIIAIYLDIIADIHRVKPIDIRDSAIKIGALGASIFSYYPDNQPMITFFDPNSERKLENDDFLSTEFENLSKILSKLKLKNVNSLIISCSANDLPKNYYNPIFNLKSLTIMQLLRLASFQAIYDILNLNI